MDVPHGARQQHSTSAPAAGPFSSDFNESFMILPPVGAAPPCRQGRKFRALSRAVQPAPRETRAPRGKRVGKRIVYLV